MKRELLFANEDIAKLAYEMGKHNGVKIEYKVVDGYEVLEFIINESIKYKIENHFEYWVDGFDFNLKNDTDVFEEKIILKENKLKFEDLNIYRTVEIKERNGYCNFIVNCEAYKKYDNEDDIFADVDELPIKKYEYIAKNSYPFASIIYEFINNCKIEFDGRVGEPKNK